MKQLQLLITLLVAQILPTSAQGLYGTTYKTTRFVTSPNTRVTAPIRRSMTVTEGLSCTSACMVDNYCVGYNLRVTSSSGALLCELLSDVVNTTFAVDSAFTTFQTISDPSDPDYVSMPQIAFSVYIDQAVSASTVVNFNNIPVNIGAVFDPVTNMFVVPRHGLYWQHIHTRTDINAMCDYSLVSTGGLPRIGVFTDNPMNTLPGYFDTLSRDDIRWLPTRTQIYVTSPNNGIASPNITLQFSKAAWSTFKLDEFMSPLVAFNVYQDSNITTPALQSQPVPFNNVVVNEGGGWNVTSYTFVAPVSGIYVFSFGTAGQTGSAPIFEFVTSTGDVYDASYQTNSTANKIHMSHRTVITNLTQGQSAWVSGLGSQSFGNMYQLASFKGFLYSPPQELKVVWWAFRTVGGGVSVVDVPISNVPINIGNAWSSPMATIPASAPGIYYIVYGVVTKPGSLVNLYLYVNGTVASAVYVSQNTATSIYREGTHMAPLASNTTVSIRVLGGTYEKGTGILGFLLYPQ